MFKVCPQCNTENELEFALCKKCGHKLEEKEFTGNPLSKTSRIPKSQPPVNIDESNKEHDFKKGIVIFGVVICFCILVAALLIN